MFLDLDRWQEVYQVLAANRVRTLLTAFGVLWGVFLLVVLLGSGRGLQNGADKEFAGRATNGFFVWTRRTTKAFRGNPPGRSVRLSNEDVQALKDANPDLGKVAPRNQLGGWQEGRNVSRGTRAGAFSVMGDVPELAVVIEKPLLRGRWLNPLDIKERRKVAAIGTRVRDVLFAPGEDPVGQHIQIRGIYFLVVGVFQAVRPGDQGARDTETIHIPLSTFQRVFNQNWVGWLACTSREGIPASLAEQNVLAALRRLREIAPHDRRALGHYNIEEEYSRVQGLFAGIQTLVWIVGLGTLAAGVVGVSNVMLVIVRERIPELGIRRALGATPVEVAGQVVLESVTLTSVAGGLGLLAGLSLLALIRELLRGELGQGVIFAEPSVSLATCAWAAGILVAAGALAGLLPALRAIEVTAVEALREGA